MAESATTSTTTSETPTVEVSEGGSASATLAADKAKSAATLKSIRDKHVKNLEKVMYADDGDKPVDPNEAAKPKDKKADKPKAETKDKAAKPEPKPGDKKQDKPEPKKADGKDSKQAETDEDAEKAERKDKRDFAKFKARYERKAAMREEDIARRESAAKQREDRLAAEIERFEKDPLGWVKGRGKDVKQVLLDLVKTESEDPRDKLLREAREKAESVEKRLQEREATERQRAAEADRAQARQEIRTELAEEWDGVRESDDYPYLSTLYEPEDVAELATQTQLAYYAKTKKGLTPGEIFARLEHSLRQEDEARSKARARRNGEAVEESSSRSPDRVRSVQSESPEASARKPTHDVTNRSTRVTSHEVGEGKANGKPDRSRWVAMARDAMTS